MSTGRKQLCLPTTTRRQFSLSPFSELTMIHPTQTRRRGRCGDASAGVAHGGQGRRGGRRRRRQRRRRRRRRRGRRRRRQASTPTPTRAAPPPPPIPRCVVSGMRRLYCASATFHCDLHPHVPQCWRSGRRLDPGPTPSPIRNPCGCPRHSGRPTLRRRSQSAPPALAPAPRSSGKAEGGFDGSKKQRAAEPVDSNPRFASIILIYYTHLYSL